MIDLHIHILPGLDDGAASREESLEMAALAVAEGIWAVVATPHVFSGLYDNTREQILESVDLLNRRLAGKNIPLTVLPGAEYRLEPALPQLLNEGRLMTVNDTGHYLLVELPTDLVPDYTEQLLYEIQLQGTVPILAHPERNPGLRRDPQRLYRLAQRGVLSQVTTGSIEGHFGQAVRRAALTMLETGVAQLVATDAHSAHADRGRTPAISAAAGEIRARWGQDFARAVLSAHPRRIIAGEAVELLLRDLQPGFLRRLRRSLFRKNFQRQAFGKENLSF